MIPIFEKVGFSGGGIAAERLDGNTVAVRIRYGEDFGENVELYLSNDGEITLASGKDTLHIEAVTGNCLRVFPQRRI